MIGIIAAMRVEMDSLRSYMEEKQEETVGGVRFVRGVLEGKDVVTAICGPGKVNAALCAQAMILHYAPAYIINTGVGGALDDSLELASVVVSSAVVQHDMDTSAVGDPVGFISGINKIELLADPQLAQRMSSCMKTMNLKTSMGVIASGDQFIVDSARKAFIAKTFGASVCEMEGAAIGHVCYVNGVPFCIIRAISDGANDNSPMDYPTFVKLAAANSVNLLRHFLRSESLA